MLAGSLVLGAAFATQAQAGRIVVNGDEWTLSDQGYANAGEANVDAFARNLAGFLDSDGSAGGNVLIYSSNFGLTGSRLLGSLGAAGYAPTISTAVGFDLPTLQAYDAIFLGGSGFAKDDAVLAAYVNGGGGVYIAAGTGAVSGGAPGEAALWNGFLADFGLELDAAYNGFIGNQASDGEGLFAGVEQLYFNNANTVSVAASTSRPEAGIRMSSALGLGLIGVYDDVSQQPAPAVPLPGTAALLCAGVALVAGRRRRG
jgi:hypothetical protein